MSFLNSYLELNFDVVKKTDNSKYGNSNDMRLVNLGPVVVFNTFKLTTSSEKHLEDISYSLIVCFMYKLKTSSKDNYDLSIFLDRSRSRRRDELALKKT